jgi:phosphoribosyl-ATP pyrophosphohydrolase/phosphoribosyl-AMP cyclohydrolase
MAEGKGGLDLSTLDFAKGGGLITVVAQDAVSGAVLMVAHADLDAMERTIATGEMHYRSRARGLWHKGETSGNVQRVVSLAADCDGDAVLARVTPAGPACHTGATTCFGEAVVAADTLAALDVTIRQRFDELQGGNASGTSGTSYTRQLLTDRNLRFKKIGEEAAELVVALADGDRKRVAEESADLVYHMLVALCGAGLTLGDVRRILEERARR